MIESCYCMQLINQRNDRYIDHGVRSLVHQYYFLRALRRIWDSVGVLTSVANPIAWRALIAYQVKSTCHHSRPCRAEFSNAWWLLCHPSPSDVHPNNLVLSTNIIHVPISNYSIFDFWRNQKKKCRRARYRWNYQLFFERSPVFHTCFPQMWPAEFTSKVKWKTYTILTPYNQYKLFSIKLLISLWNRLDKWGIILQF